MFRERRTTFSGIFCWYILGIMFVNSDNFQLWDDTMINTDCNFRNVLKFKPCSSIKMIEKDWNKKRKNLHACQSLYIDWYTYQGRRMNSRKFKEKKESFLHELVCNDGENAIGFMCSFFVLSNVKFFSPSDKQILNLSTYNLIVQSRGSPRVFS